MPETSPAGEAGSGTGSSDKEFSCPTCGDTFTSINGRNVHHYQKHGESLAFGEYECDICGDTFERRKCNMKDSHEHQTCGRACQNKLIGKLNVGEKNHNYVDSWVTCSNCGDEIEVQPIKLETQDNYFCDFGCYGDWLSETNFGEAHHQYKPNKPTSRFYQTAKWRAARVEALDRDNHTCQGCGETNKLVVHHIIPIADNGPKYDLDNLVTLCRPCHAKWEGLYLRPDTR